MASRKKTTHIVIHCADTYPDMDVGFKEINHWHRQRGWWGCGYHAIIRRDGSVEKGRPANAPGAHARGFNAVSYAICMVGGKDKEGLNRFEPVQFETLTLIIDEARLEWPDAVIVGHNEINSKKTCPNFDVPQWLREEGYIKI